MTSFQKSVGVVALVAALLVGLVIGKYTSHNAVSPGFLGSIQTAPLHLTDSGTLNNEGSLFLWDTQAGGGLEVATTTWFDGAVNASGTVTFAGAVSTGAVTASSITDTGTLAVTATSTLTGTLVANNVQNSFGSTVSSTIQVGAASKSGCLILGDSANGASAVYIVASGSTVTASTTKPAACQTVR